MHIGAVDGALRDLELPASGDIEINLSDVEALDTAGAWLVHRTELAWADRGAAVTLQGIAPGQVHLLESVRANDEHWPAPPETGSAFVAMVERVGRATPHPTPQHFRENNTRCRRHKIGVWGLTIQRNQLLPGQAVGILTTRSGPHAHIKRFRRTRHQSAFQAPEPRAPLTVRRINTAKFMLAP